MGHPKYEIFNLQSSACLPDGQVFNEKQKTKKQKREPIIELDGEEIGNLRVEERARRGLFLANQYPVAIPGLITQSFLWQLYKMKFKMDDLESAATGKLRNKTEKTNNREVMKAEKEMTLLEFRKWLEVQAEVLDLDRVLLKRGLNDGFSGGEKKKLEVLQMLVCNPKYIILDEIDSGLDVDALRKIAQTVARVAKERKIGVIVITHYARILNYLKPDKVHILGKGKIRESGGWEMVEKVEKEGYQDLKQD
jgi:Fe-S cluster assembly ATP-binding protein